VRQRKQSGAGPATATGFTLLETLVALALAGLALIVTLALLAQEPRAHRRLDAHRRALDALGAALEAVRAGRLTPAGGPIDPAAAGLEPMPFLDLRAEVHDLSPPGLARLVVVASYAVDGRRVERRVETLLWRPP